MISTILPAPKHSYSIYDDVDSDEEAEKFAALEARKKAQRVIPPYGQRQKYVPVALEDFGDGGAFPEIHLVQFPLNMGKPGVKSTAVVTVDVDKNGEIKYDAIVKQGANRDKIVHTSMESLKEGSGNEDVKEMPTEDEETETAERTQKALEALLDGKIAKAKPNNATQISIQNNQQKEPEYIRYSANANAPGYDPALKNRVIRMVEEQVDPMEPPKHKHKKIPRGPGSPPVPVLHSPPRKLTVADQQAWKIPPCISNWKNARGYTIPLDKRLAADGRGLQELTINNKFATLSESLYIAERKASEDLRVRNQIRKKMAMREMEDKEAELRELANRARAERSGMMGTGGAATDEKDYYRSNNATDAAGERLRDSHRDVEDLESSDEEDGDVEKSRRRGERYDEEGGAYENEAERTARLEREKLRVERRKERERELRMDNMKGARKGKLDRDRERDVSEKIALGLHRGSAKLSGEAMYDSRLFNQSEGMDSGFGAEDDYNTYTKPLFDKGSQSSSIYRPKRDAGDAFGDAEDAVDRVMNTSRFKADKGFKGAEENAGVVRDGPVQFMKADASKKQRHDDE